MSTARAEPGPIARILEMTPIGVDVFRTVRPSLLASADARGEQPSQPGDRLRVFGGQLLAQALRAATLTAPPARAAHSLHAYFVNGAHPDEPLELEVVRVRDGGSVSNRLVNVRQGERSVLTLQASFQVGVTGSDRGDPPPLALGRHADLPDASGEAAHVWSGVRMRFDTAVDSDRWTPTTHRVHRNVWLKINEELPDDAAVRACALAYASDLTLLRTALLAETSERDGAAAEEADGSAEFRLASLDHAMWFHRPFEPEQWLLFTSVAPSTSASRGLALGSLYDERGRLVATVAQEGVVRRLGPGE
jgi:acyl-CoA thioesterase-2